MKRLFGRSGTSSGSSSGRSSANSYTKSEETKAPPTDGMSTTAKLILDTLEKMSTPLKDSEKIPTLNIDRKRVAEELNNSLGLTGSARKRPRLGTGPMQSGSPLGGPPFRKLYSPLSAHRSRPPRVNHITPMASLNNSRPTTPYGLEKSSASNPPPAPNSLPLSSFSTPLTGGGAGGGKLRSKVTGRGGPMDALENEEPPPPLPAFLTNNVPQLKVSTPLNSFSFATSTPAPSIVKEPITTTTAPPIVQDSITATENNNNKADLKADNKSTENKEMPPIFGLTKPLTTVASEPKFSFGSDKMANVDKDTKNTNSMFSFSSPVQTILHNKKDSPVKEKPSVIPAFNKESTTTAAENKIAAAAACLVSNLSSSTKPSSPSVIVTNGHDTKDKSAVSAVKTDNKSSASNIVMTNGLDTSGMVFTFAAPKTVTDKVISLNTSCSMSFTFSPPESVKGK